MTLLTDGIGTWNGTGMLNCGAIAQVLFNQLRILQIYLSPSQYLHCTAGVLTDDFATLWESIEERMGMVW